MGKATMGNLDGCGVLPLLEAMSESAWSGVLRLRNGRGMGAVWMVKGQVVHALLMEGETALEGHDALRPLAGWTDGTYWLDEDSLPPARTIRATTEELLAALHAHAPLTQEAERLQQVLSSLRERVPGLESLSLTKGVDVAATTARNAQERDWLATQLRAYFPADGSSPEKLYLQQGEHSLLIMKRGHLHAVLMAQPSTAPEALFWAAEEAGRRVLTDS